MRQRGLCLALCCRSIPAPQSDLAQPQSGEGQAIGIPVSRCQYRALPEVGLSLREPVTFQGTGTQVRQQLRAHAGSLWRPLGDDLEITLKIRRGAGKITEFQAQPSQVAQGQCLAFLIRGVTVAQGQFELAPGITEQALMLQELPEGVVDVRQIRLCLWCVDTKQEGQAAVQGSGCGIECVRQAPGHKTFEVPEAPAVVVGQSRLCRTDNIQQGLQRGTKLPEVCGRDSCHQQGELHLARPVQCCHVDASRRWRDDQRRQGVYGLRRHASLFQNGSDARDHRESLTDKEAAQGQELQGFHAASRNPHVTIWSGVVRSWSDYGTLSRDCVDELRYSRRIRPGSMRHEQTLMPPAQTL